MFLDEKFTEHIDPIDPIDHRPQTRIYRVSILSNVDLPIDYAIILHA